MILKIKDSLRDNEDKILEVLEEIGCCKIRKVKENEFRFGIDENSSGSANSLFIDTLSYTSFSRGIKGDILTLVSEIKGMALGESIRWLANKLNIKKDYQNTDIKLPFGGFFKNFSKIKDDDTTPTIYPINRLDKYNTGVSKMWIDDGISAIVQEYFNIGFCHDTNRIVIPWFTESGELVGIMSRLNKLDILDKEMKYYPIIAFSKSKVLYGLDKNYKEILNKNIIIIVESEKSVMKAYEFGYKNVVALGGNNISERHSKLIKSMYCNVIISFDEGLELSHCIEQASKCKIKNPFFTNEVYVMDMEGLQEKSCVFDLDEDTIKKSFNERLIYVGE